MNPRARHDAGFFQQVQPLLLSLLLFTLMAPSWALRPGALEVLSEPSEPFRAQLELSELPEGLPLSALQVRLASPPAYAAAGEPFPQELEGLKVVSMVAHGALLWATLQAAAPAAASPLRLRIELLWPSGRRSAYYIVEARAGARAEPGGGAEAAGVLPNESGSLRVQAGDTLWGIASRLPSSGMSLDRRMVALYRANPQAFAGNLNLLRAGSVLKLPSAEQVASVDAADAAQTLRLESEDFQARRRRQAQQVLNVPQQPDQSAAGEAQAAALPPPAAASGPRDRLTLAAPGPAADPAAQISDQAAAQELRRKESEVHRLNEMLQRLQPAQSASAASAASSSASPGTAAAPAAAATASAADAPIPAPTVPTPVSVAAVAVAASSAAPAARAAQALEQGLLDQEWAMLAAIGMVVALTALALARLLRRRRPSVPETTFLPSQYAEDPVLLAPTRAPGATAAEASMADAATAAGSLTLEQALAAFDASGEIDPVAEAEVYMAYARDAQAQEILTEAMQADPSHLGVQVKLLEIFVRRKERDPAQALVRLIRARSGGEGEHWQRASALAQSAGLLNEASAEAADSRLHDRERSRFANTLPGPEEPEPARPPQQAPAPAPSATPAPGAAFARTAAPLEVVLEADIPVLANEAAGEPVAASAGPPLPSAADHERKLALAEEFGLIGDPQAARDLLREVIEQADEALAARARAALERIA